MTRVVSVDALADTFRPGERIYLPGSAGAPIALMDAFAARPERTRDLRILTSFIPPINPLALDRLDPSVQATGLFMQPGLAGAQREGRYHHLPVSFSGFVEHVRDRAEIDTCVVQVAPPDAQGRCSLGAAVEFTPIAHERGRRTVALVNPNVPAIPGAQTLPFEDFDLAAEVGTELPTYEIGAPSAAAETIAARIAAFIRDGATLQVGLGKVPEALFDLLRDRRGLRLQSGMLSDGALRLSRSEALDRDFRHTSCVWVGSGALYRDLSGLAGFEVRSCEVTHDLSRLTAIDGFVAVNSALSVDLFGQANLEHAGAHAVSGVGGATDFATAARVSRGGISIVALPAAFGREPRSRIVPRIGDGIASLARHAIDVVVTEHGAADLRGRSVHARAEALIEVAAPDFRRDLAAAWADIARQL